MTPLLNLIVTEKMNNNQERFNEHLSINQEQ
jgi:hypothetical protein